jgi:LmbE family N-acetylglucosaminyl deacetylase
MKRWLVLSMTAFVLSVAGPSLLRAQTALPEQTVKGPDERFKTDILVVVAHPDDEGGVTPYLARAIYDQHKRVAVVFATRGGSGGNDYSREHGPALADLREQEARAACGKLGITDVWFLEGKDTASQNVLNSLANWGHGANLEALVRIVRLTRPEVIITWLPGIFMGENHGDHQAAGVLATEAFDLAGEETTFPAQVTGATKRLEMYLENLTPWQPKKLYYFSDADDQKQFDGAGPAYSVKEVSPSQRKPYWRLALDAATPHLTQFPEDIHRMTAMSDEQIMKFMEDPQHMWWAEPMTLIFGKASVQTKATDDVFADLNSSVSPYSPLISPIAPSRRTWLEIGGPWFYYDRFRPLHHLGQSKGSAAPEIAIKAGTSLLIPLMVFHKDSGPSDVEIAVTAPVGWQVKAGEGKFRLPEENRTAFLVEVAPPELSKEELKKIAPQEVVVRGVAAGKSIGEVRLKVQLKMSALAQ